VFVLTEQQTNVTVHERLQGTGTGYGLDGLGIEYCRSQWPSGLRRGSAANRLLGLRVRIPSGTWMLVLCVVSKDKRQNAGQSRQTSSDEVQAKYKKIQKKSRWGEIFRTLPDRAGGPPGFLYNGYRVSFPGVKRTGHGVDHPHLSNAEVKEGVEVYLSPSGPS
jgi:hypothetical protein